MYDFKTYIEYFKVLGRFLPTNGKHSAMVKFGYIFAFIVGVIVFNSCTQRLEFTSHQSESFIIRQPELKKSYGAYLAGRVAHLRKNFNVAADYYMEALNEDPENKDLLGRVYVILASKGRISEAAKYAEISLKKGDQNNFTYIIMAVDEMKKGRYEQVNETVSHLDGPVYKEFIIPLMSAWAYAGLDQPDKALKTLAVLDKEPSFRALYHFHAGMLNDYFDRKDEARRHYEIIVNDESMEMSFRSLQVITNFYIRNGEKNKAVQLATRYTDEKLLADMLNKLARNIRRAAPEKTAKIVDDPNIGMSEALFSIAATLRQGTAGIDLAHIFISLSIYANPQYDLAKLLLADILESREMYAEANGIYDEIDEGSEAYYSAQVKKAGNLVTMQDYAAAELLLKSLTLENQRNYQLLLDLGDVLRIRNKQDEAISYYKDAIKSLSKIENQHWVLFYALGISYESLGEWKEAEKSFRKSLALSQNHYLALNFLGYSLLKHGKNVDEAFGMIVDAYNQLPNDGHITDSLGWAFYRLGQYDKAIEYLEKAAELEPSNALISDHLGDAYWFGGRRNEAVFQWNHALILEDDSGELNKSKVREKLASRSVDNQVLKYTPAVVNEKTSQITKE